MKIINYIKKILNFQKNKNDVIFHINKNSKSNIKRNNIQYLLDFTLLWNLFELKYFDNFFKVYDRERNINLIDDFINIHWNNIDDNRINKYFNYFKDRYTVNEEFDDEINEKIKNRFDKLNIRWEHINIIKNNLSNSENKLYTVIYIIARYRNNFFHWMKNVKFIGWQKENFEISNNFLLHILYRN